MQAVAMEIAGGQAVAMEIAGGQAVATVDVQMQA